MPHAIDVIATLTAHAEHEDVVVAAVAAAIPRFRVEDGCLRYELYRDNQQAGRMFTVERWRDEDALNVHKQAEAFKTLARQIDGRADLEIIQVLPMI